MKNVVKLQHYYFPWELEAAVRDFVSYYNHRRYQTSAMIADGWRRTRL
jgi:hypothetical protein